jgi:hypothetical protein
MRANCAAVAAYIIRCPTRPEPCHTYLTAGDVAVGGVAILIDFTDY